MTIDEFNRLPLLLRRGEVVRITGLTPRDLCVLREQGTLETALIRREVRYLRESVRRLVGLHERNGNHRQ